MTLLLPALMVHTLPFSLALVLVETFSDSEFVGLALMIALAARPVLSKLSGLLKYWLDWTPYNSYMCLREYGAVKD